MTTIRVCYRHAIIATMFAIPVMSSDAQGRPQVSGLEAAVSSDHPLASAAGADVLRRGGNAIDAAITMAGVLTVTRPHMNGPGGDVFMIYYDAKTKKVYTLNGSGRAGSKATPAFFVSRSLKEVPNSGILSVSVPGTVQAWADALDRFGTITLAKALEPAIMYAEKGFPVTPRLAADLRESSRKVAADPELSRTFTLGGAVPAVGTSLRQADLAKSLRAIASVGPAAFYKGDIARHIVAYMEKEGGLLTADDLARHTSTWGDPIETSYHGLRVLAFAPPTQGATMLQLLNIAEQFDLKAMGHNSGDYINTLTRASQLAYRDRDAFIADPAFTPVPLDKLLSKSYARELANQIRAAGSGGLPDASAQHDGSGDTIYLCVVDKDGNAVSYIQSLFAAFGSGKMVPGTGITLHNRGSLYVLDPAHPQIIAPGKRPFHTLNPAMVLNADGSPYMVLGSPGGDGQPQTVVQVLNNMVLFGMEPQAAIEARRLQAVGLRASVEVGMFVDSGAALRVRGLTMREEQPGAAFGGASAIVIHPASKARMVGSDFRREAFGIAW
ncbi:MAG: gamma-glutamyltransferase [Gemmatimonadota bacterium]